MQWVEKDEEELARLRKGKGRLLNIWNSTCARNISCQAPRCQGSVQVSSIIPHTSLQLHLCARTRLQREADTAGEIDNYTEKSQDGVILAWALQLTVECVRRPPRGPTGGQKRGLGK